MAIETLGAAVRQINRLFADGSVTGVSDAQLLERFVRRRDATSFEALVARHGPMVLSVCRGILRDPNDADDAFQATFLILVKKAGTFGESVVLGGWLYQVAHRVAIQANIAAGRRRAREREAGQLKTASGPSGPVIGDELLPALHEEIARLPEKHRLPILLCELEGLSQAQAAGQLRWSERTLRRRLGEARDRLKGRLARRGLSPDNAMLGAVFLREAGVAVPASLNESTVRAALDLVHRTIAAGTVSAAAGALAQEVVKMMLFQRLKWVSAALLAAGAGGIVAATFAVDSNDEPRRREKPPGVIASKPEPKREFMEAVGEGRKPVSIAGRVLDPDGRPLSAAKIYVRHSHWFDRGEESRAVEQPTTTDTDGLFRVDLDASKSDAPVGDGPPWHAAMIAAVAPGYGPAWITAGEAVKGGAELRLVRDDLPIRGRVLDSQARPVAGAAVRVEFLGLTRDGVDLDGLLASGKLDWDGSLVPAIRRPQWPSPTWIGRDGRVTTDADGRFELKGLGRDRAALLRIEGSGIESGRIAVLDRASRGSRRVPGQSPVTFDSVNGEMGLGLYGTSFEHIVGPDKPIAGVVRMKGTGRPLAGVTIAAQVLGRVWSVVMTKTDESGHFRLSGLAKSPSYQVDVRPMPGASYLGGKPQTVSDTEGLKPIAMTFELSRGVAVRGRLIDKQTGRAVPCDQVIYFPLPNNPHREGIHGTASGTDDSFRITVPPGGGMIAVKARGKSIPYPGARLVPADKGKLQVKGEDGSEFGVPLSMYQAYRFVDYAERTESATLDLEVTSGTSRKVELVGESGRPVTGASAMGLTTDKFASTTIDGAHFDVQGLRPDETRLVEIRHEGLGVGGSVSISGSEPADRPLIVKLARNSAISGRLLDEDGVPLRGAKVEAIVVKRQGFGASDPNFRPRATVSDVEGRFRIDGINPTLGVLLWFHKPGAAPYSHQPKSDKDLSNLIAGPGETVDLKDVTVQFQKVE